MSSTIMLILSLFNIHYSDNVYLEKDYYAYTLDKHADPEPCTVTPCPHPKDY